MECLPEDLTAEESALLTPVPSSPPLPPLPTDLDRSLLKVKMDYIYQKYTNETITTVMFTNLIPSTTYCIRAKAFSVSGWSKFCRIVSQKTLAYVPDAPDPVDICKISTNGLLLSWYKPVRDNGMPVDFYQIELMDAKMAIPVMEQESGKIITGSDVATSDTVASPGHTGKFSSGSPPPVSLPGHHTAIGSHQGSQNSSHQHKHHRLQHKRLPTNPVKAGVASRFHRLLKHKNLQYLHK